MSARFFLGVLALGACSGFGPGAGPAAAQGLPANHYAQRRHSAALEAIWRGSAASLGARAFDPLVRRPAPPLYWHSAEDWLPLLGRAATGDAWELGGEWLYGLEFQCTPGWWGRSQVGVGARGPLPEDPAERSLELRLYPRAGAAVPEGPVELQVVVTAADGAERAVRTQTIESSAWRRPGFTLYVERAELLGARSWAVRLKNAPAARRPLPLPEIGADWETRWDLLLAREVDWSEQARRVIDELHLWRERGARPPHGAAPGVLLGALEAEAEGRRVAGAPWPVGEPERGPWVLESRAVEAPRGALVWVAAGDGAPDEIFAGALGARLAAFAERSGWAVVAVSGSGLSDLEPWLAERGLGGERAVLCVPRGAALLPVQLWRAQLGEAGARVLVAREVRRLPAPPDSEGLPRLWAPGLERPDGPFDADAGVLPCFSDFAWMTPIEEWWERTHTTEGADD